MRKQAWVPQEGNVTECTGDAGALLQSGEDQRGITAKGNSTGPWIKKKKSLSSTAGESLGVDWMLTVDLNTWYRGCGCGGECPCRHVREVKCSGVNRPCLHTGS